MLVVHSSNRLEVLLQRLLQTMQDSPADPFLAETIVVQNHGMSRWISQQIAMRRGVCANLTTPSPGLFMWQLPGYWIDDWPDKPPISKDTLLWQIYALLPDLLPTAPFAELRRYLQADKSGSGQFQLSQRIANAFDQYLVYRPELILHWENDGASAADNWQPILWRAVLAALQQKAEDNALLSVHWGRVGQHFYPALLNNQPVKPLPLRISVFGVASMPPLYIDLLNAASAHIDISIYYVNPCREYWADIVDERGLSRRRARARQAGEDDPTGLLDIGNPLLASWGLAGQAFLDQLLEAGVNEDEYFSSPSSQNLLAKVQTDILELINRSQPELAVEAVASDDKSIQIHSAHSRLREVQILHDQLLALFQSSPDLEPRDIIVMAPDIDLYAPFIDATFASVDSPMRIPWSIADRRLRSEQRLLDTFCQLIDLPVSRFEASEILSLLEVAAVSRRFGLDKNGLQYLRTWIAESGIRWSLDADMKKDHALPAEAANTWEFGLQRLFLGYAMPSTDESLYHGIFPYEDIEGTSALYLGALQQFISVCAEWRRELAGDRPIADWIETLERLTESFFSPEDDETYAIQMLRSALHEISDHAQATQLQRDVSRSAIVEILHQLLDDDSNSRQFITGQVTFSNMVPMRSIPFRVVCLIGMNSDGFPRDDRPDSFNLVARKPRRGDRSRRTDDRYLFLETLLSARETFYLSYIGNDVRDDSAKAPSIVVTELQDYINKGYRRSSGASSCSAKDSIHEPEVPDDCLTVVKHPLQPFSKLYFDGSSPDLINYKPHWFSAAGVKVRDEVVRFYDQPLKEDESRDDTVELSRLLNFYKDPARQFLIQGLQVQLLRDEAQLEDDEPFALDGLQKWDLKQQISSKLLTGFDQAKIHSALRAQGILPIGSSGDQLVSGALSAVEQFLHRLAHRQMQILPAQEIHLACGRFTLTGQLEGLQSNRVDDADTRIETETAELPDTDLLLHRLGSMRASDLLEAWIKHLAKCHHLEVSGHTVLVCEDKTCIFTPVTNAEDLLVTLLELYQSGLVKPLHLFPETSLTYVNKLSDSVDDSLHKDVVLAWTGGRPYSGASYQPGEANREAVSLVWRGQDPIRDPMFKSSAEMVFAPLLGNGNILKAAEDLL